MWIIKNFNTESINPSAGSYVQHLRIHVVP